MNALKELRHRFRQALESVDADAGRLAEMVLPSQDARFGDYQANCAMPLGKRLGKPPREIAQQLVDAVDVADLCDPCEIAGPGFINLRLKNDWLIEQLRQVAVDQQRLAIEQVEAPRTYVLDYSSPNVAKPMHVGHIRSTVIGDALCRVLRFLGHQVISDNHIGDWGTQFGMIIYGYKHFVNEQDLAHDAVAELSRLYKLVNQLVEYHETVNQKIPALEQQIVDYARYLDQMHDATIPEDPKEHRKADKRLKQTETQLAEVRKTLDGLRKKVLIVDEDPQLSKLAAEHEDIGTAVLTETAALHAGDATNRALWEKFLPPCLAEIEETYRRLKVSFDHTLGESFYEDRLAGVVEDLQKKGLVRESEGAKCIFLKGHDAPMIVQKQDGAYLYATTDLATVAYRLQQWSPDVILYVVDHRQSLHFDQLFAAVRLWGYADVELKHISFGTVLGEDGRPYKTRTGSAVGLTGLLDEAVQRALNIVADNDDARPEPLLTESDRREVAERIGIGAIKYADLSHNRSSDYVFSYDKMLAMTGNTAAYMQYSYARVRSIFGKSGVDAETVRRADVSVLIESGAERALALTLLQFGEAIDRVVEDYRPNHLTAYLFNLASKYSDFFESCPVLRAETNELRTSRLLLCDLTARTIARGLDLLGIEVVERM